MAIPLQRQAQALGLALGQPELDRFQRYYDYLAEASRRLNLTAVTDYQGVQRRHFLESLALLTALYQAKTLRQGQEARLLDLGSGAGFPGLPMKIAHPQLRLWLLEAQRKKAAFLEGLVETLGLPEVRVVAERAEELAHDLRHREAYDLVVARAVAPLAVLVELSLPFLRLGGYLAAPKGSRAPQEMTEALRALTLCGGHIERAVPLAVPGAPYPQTLVLIGKITRTPPAYPRRAGIPQRRPL